MPICIFIPVVVLVGTGLPIGLHFVTHGAINIHQIGLAFFLWVNALIAFWELCLFFRHGLVEGQYQRFKAEYRGQESRRVLEFALARRSLGDLFSLSLWAEVWSTYALFDESYADKRSFGFVIDIGNGFVTLLPSVVLLYGMTYDFVSARTLGILGLLLHYQVFYGTVLYFASYVLNGRYRGHARWQVLLFVILPNAFWLVFPIWGFIVSLVLIHDNSYACFLC